jgi:large subunit ribosomal protein L4
VLVNDDVVFTKDSLDVFLASKAQQGSGSAEATATVVDEEASK